MKSLSLYVKKIQSFLSFRLRDKCLLLRVFLLTGIIRMIILTIPFRKMKKYMGNLNKESDSEAAKEEYDVSRRISWAIKTIVKYTPWESKCLVQALTAQYLLCRKGIQSTLYLGVGKEKCISEGQKEELNMIAHSWIRCGKLYVTGGNGEGFAVVAKFMKGA